LVHYLRDALEVFGGHRLRPVENVRDGSDRDTGVLGDFANADGTGHNISLLVARRSPTAGMNGSFQTMLKHMLAFVLSMGELPSWSGHNSIEFRRVDETLQCKS
jgi:hypothetical protein